MGMAYQKARANLKSGKFFLASEKRQQARTVGAVAAVSCLIDWKLPLVTVNQWDSPSLASDMAF
jgi:hypothetical protein